MKKLIALALIFMFSNTIFAQETAEKKAKKTKARTEKVVKEKKEKDFHCNRGYAAAGFLLS